MSPKLIVMPPLSNGRIRQPAPFGGICHAVGVPPACPVSVSLQVVEPWSNAQLCPPPVDGCAGSLCSKTELSGTKIEPAVPVKRAPGDQLTAGGWPRTKPPGGNVVPSAHTAQAKFWQRKVSTVAHASIRRARLAKFASPRFRIIGALRERLKNTHKVCRHFKLQFWNFGALLHRPYGTMQRKCIRSERPPRPESLHRSRRSRNQTRGLQTIKTFGGAGKFRMIRRFTSAHSVPASVGALRKPVWGQALSAQRSSHQDDLQATKFFAQMQRINSQGTTGPCTAAA